MQIVTIKSIACQGGIWYNPISYCNELVKAGLEAGLVLLLLAEKSDYNRFLGDALC
jgi:hypothetical protein